MNICVVDEEDAEIASGRDLQALRDELGVQAQKRFAPENPWEREGLKTWEGFELPESTVFDREGQSLVGYPALTDEGESVSLTLMDTPEKARVATRCGVNRLVRLELKEQMTFLERSLPGFSQLALLYAPLGNAERLRHDLIAAIVDRAVWAEDAPVRNRHTFEARLKQVKSRILVVAQDYTRLAIEVLTDAQAVRKTLDGPLAAKWREGCADMRRQLAEPDLRRLHRSCAVHAAAGVSAVPQGDGAAAREDPELVGAGFEVDRRDRAAVEAVRRPAGEASQDWRQRSEPKRVPVATGGAARVALRPGAENALPGVGKAAGEAVGDGDGVTTSRSAASITAWRRREHPRPLLRRGAPVTAKACVFSCF